MTCKKILATALVASLSFGLANAKIVFDFENLADGSPVSSSTGASTGWTSGGNTWSSSASGDDSLFAHITASGYYSGGVISNSKTNTGKTSGADLDTIKGGAASGNNYGVLYFNGYNSSDTSKNTYKTADGKTAYKSQFGYNEYLPGGGSKFVSEIMSSSVIFDSAVQVGSIDISMTMYTYFELDNPDNHNNYMGTFFEDEEGNKTYNSINNNEGSFFGVRIFALDENYEIADETNFVEQLLAYNDNGNVYFELDWKTIDISKLGASGVFGLAFQIISSFGNDYRITAPAYLAIDNIASIPEPAACAAALGLAALILAAYRRRK